MKQNTTKRDRKVSLKTKVPEYTPCTNNILNKYRRIKTLQRKCAELSHLCKVDIVCIIYDSKYHRFREIRTADQMTEEKMHDLMSANSQNGKAP